MNVRAKVCVVVVRVKPIVAGAQICVCEWSRDSVMGA